jgi:MSHA biogenesis protein MshE
MGDVSTEFGNILGLTAGAEDAPVVKLLKTVFEEALKMRASDIHIEPQEKSLLIRFRIDGVLHVQTEADAKISTALVLRLKLMSGLDISEKRLPQDGRFNIKLRNTCDRYPHLVDADAARRIGGDAPAGAEHRPARTRKLHMPPRMLERFRHSIARPSGMVLVTGPTGSGKTTTLYAALNELNTPEKKDHHRRGPGRIPAARWPQPGAGARKDRPVLQPRAALRAAPGPGHHPARRNARPGNRRNRHARGDDRPPGAVDPAHQRRLVDADPPARHGRAALHGGLSIQMVLAQRLVRVICENCRASYTPTPHEHLWLRYELGDQVDAMPTGAARVAAHCANTGYQGRQAVYEILEMNNALVEAVNRGDPNEFMQIGREQMAGNTLRRDAVRLVLSRPHHGRRSHAHQHAVRGIGQMPNFSLSRP